MSLLFHSCKWHIMFIENIFYHLGESFNTFKIPLSCYNFQILSNNPLHYFHMTILSNSICISNLKTMSDWNRSNSCCHESLIFNNCHITFHWTWMLKKIWWLLESELYWNFMTCFCKWTLLKFHDFFLYMNFTKKHSQRHCQLVVFVMYILLNKSYLIVISQR